MAYQPETNEAFANTVREALARKLSDGEAPCAVCGATASTINRSPYFLRTITPDGELAGSGQRQDGIEVAAIWCGGCGFLRLHAVPPLVAD